MNDNQPVISRKQVEDALKQVADGYIEFLNIIDEELEQRPDDNPIDRLVEQLNEQGVRGWATLYVDPRNQIASLWLSFMPPETFRDMVGAINSMSADQQTEWIQRFYSEGGQAIQSVMEMDAVAIQKAWPGAVKSSTGSLWLPNRLNFLMASLFNTLAAMQTGKTMYQLVAEAQEGNDDSFFKAVQMDKTVLEYIPYFKEQCLLPLNKKGIAFFRRLHEHSSKSITITRLQYAKLWLVFDTLDNMNLLDQFEQDIKGFAELCQSIRVYGPHPDVEPVDLEDFKSRLKDFRRTHRRLLPSAPSSILVKEVSSANSPP